MGLRVLKAPARGGKTAWAVQQTLQLSSGLKNVPFVLLPSRTQVDDFRYRLADGKGSLGVYLGTFLDLAGMILDRSDLNLILVSETVQIKLLQKILERMELNYYRLIKDKPGFTQTVLGLIREIEAGMIEPGGFSESIAEIDQDGRLGELTNIYKQYRQEMFDRNWVDPAGLIWMAVELLSQHPEACPVWDVLIVDGFDDFSPGQLELIRLLAQHISDVIVTVTADGEGRPRPLVHKRFNRLLEDLTANQRVEIINLDDVKTSPGDDIFTVLERNLFTGDEKKIRDPEKSIQLVAVPDREAEVRSALRWINKLVSNGQIKYSQAALTMRNLEPYRKIISKIAFEYGLPVMIMGGLPLDENPALRAVINLLNLAKSGKRGLGWQEVVAVWESPYFDWRILPPAISSVYTREQHLLEAHLLSEIARWGSVIQGFGQWLETFDRLQARESEYGIRAHSNTVPDPLPAGDLAARLWVKFSSFVELIAPPQDGQDAEVYIRWIEDLLGDLNLENDRNQGLNLWERIMTGGEELVQRDIQAIKRLTELLREQIWADQMLGPQSTTFQAVLLNIESDIKRSSYHVSQQNSNLIICADCTEIRGVSFKAVALLGMAEGEFPGTIKEDPFLRDDDRAVLRDKYGLLLRPSTESAEAEFFYEALTRASLGLYITRPRIAENGAPWQPSPYWEELVRTLDLNPELKTSRDVPPLSEVGSQTELYEALSGIAIENRQDLMNRIRQLYPEYSSRVANAAQVIEIRTGSSRAGDMGFDGLLDPMATGLDDRFPADMVWSASRLENYHLCPFSFFVNYLLGLEKPELPQEGLDARQLGNIYHQILEELYLDAEPDYDIEGLLEQLPVIAQKIFGQAPLREGFRETAWWPHTQREIVDNIKHSLIVLEEADSNFKFFRAEQKFGIRDHAAPQLRIEVEGEGTYYLRGLIDRVDINQQGELRIIDYKTSSPYGFDNQAVREGKKLQLPLYAMAAQQGLELGEVQEGFYFHVRTAQPSSFKLSSFWNDGSRGTKAAINVAARKGWESVSSIKKGFFEPETPGNGCPEYCPAVDFCWHYQRQNW